MVRKDYKERGKVLLAFLLILELPLYTILPNKMTFYSLNPQTLEVRLVFL